MEEAVFLFVIVLLTLANIYCAITMSVQGDTIRAQADIIRQLTAKEGQK
jgi:hypothetical protein